MAGTDFLFGKLNYVRLTKRNTWRNFLVAGGELLVLQIKSTDLEKIK